MKGVRLHDLQHTFATVQLSAGVHFMQVSKWLGHSILHVELVRATGKLADPTDLPFDESHIDDPSALDAAITDLISRKPHLASRRPAREIGQGASPSTANVDLAAILRQRA